MLNKEQQEAYDNIMEYLVSDDYNNFFVLSGKAGTGKTYLIGEVVKNFPKVFAVAAISHKAKEIIASKIVTPNVEAFTIARLLAMVMHPETGEFSKNPYSDFAPIFSFRYIVIDECSMIDEKTLKLIMDSKNSYTKIIFVGDRGQIPPIRKYQTKKKKLSPTFNVKYKSELVERVRQGKDHPILNYSDYFWQSANEDKPDMTDLVRPSILLEDGKGISYHKSVNEAVIETLDLFRKAVADRNSTLIKAVTYRNDLRQTINRVVRKRLFGETPKHFELGDMLIMLDNYSDDKIILDNSVEFSVLNTVPRKRRIESRFTSRGVEMVQEHLLDYYLVSGLTFDGRLVELPIVSPESSALFNTIVKDAFQYAKGQSGSLRKKAFEEAWATKNIFANCDFAYAITAHKSQGSTYDTVIVNVTDMLSAPIIDADKASLIYTSMTRASRRAYMCCKDF